MTMYVIITALHSLFDIASLLFLLPFPTLFLFFVEASFEIIVVELNLGFENTREVHSPFQFPVDCFRNRSFSRFAICNLRNVSEYPAKRDGWIERKRTYVWFENIDGVGDPRVAAI